MHIFLNSRELFIDSKLHSQLSCIMHICIPMFFEKINFIKISRTFPRHQCIVLKFRTDFNHPLHTSEGHNVIAKSSIQYQGEVITGF